LTSCDWASIFSHRKCFALILDPIVANTRNLSTGTADVVQYEHHRDEEAHPALEDPNTLTILACVDLSNTICKILGTGYRQPRVNIDLVNHPVFNFLEIPPADALVEESAEAFSREAAYWAG
jgi:hypothetical protein